MASVGDVLQLIDTQRYQSQRIINVYFYRLDTPVVGNAAEMLVSSFQTEVLPEILLSQTSQISHTSLAAKNIFDESEAHEELISEVGGYATDTLPTFAATGFRLIGSNAAVNDGQKRIAGVPESAQTNSIITDAAFLTQLGVLAASFAAGLPIGLDIDALIPVVVQRIAMVGGGYRLPANQGEAVLSTVLDALFNIDVTSQTSRKIGVGE